MAERRTGQARSSSLLVRHLPDSDPPRFQVLRLPDGKCTDGAEVVSPMGYPVEGRPNDDLSGELRWYLESFLEYPFPPETEHAERVQTALREWGEKAFGALLGGGKGRDLYSDAVRDGVEHVDLQISSDDPRILAWPWEAVRDPERGCLALSCRVERNLNHVADPVALSEGLPTDRVNILLVTARPYEGDVGYRSISRPLVDLIEELNLPAKVTVLRPPTFAGLRRHLHDHPDTYHILHFDGHGGYGETTPSPGGMPFLLEGPEGHLIFETDDGKPDAKSAGQLGVLLREYRIPAVVLNACQSGMVDHRARDAFASVAASLVKAGIRSVVAMAYSLYVSGAQQFLPSFYRRLFETGDASEGVRAGRQKMYENKGRICARGRWDLEDWLVPVVYQQDPVDFSFAEAAEVSKDESKPELPPEARDEENPYGFVGRDGAILALERAMRRKPAGILVHGLGGVGKTTLARGFLQWLWQTDGLGEGSLWLSFQEVRSAEYVLNRMGEALFGPDFITAPRDRKIAALVDVFREHPFVLVWDNFESVTGAEGASSTARWKLADREVLESILKQLRGGKTKVLITSRSEESWLGTSNRQKIALGGLGPEERWEYCQAILDDQDFTIDRDDPGLSELMETLNGHPLMMRAVLPLLEDRTASEITAALRTNLKELGLEGKDTHEKILATLRFVERSIPEELQVLLFPVSLHEGYVDADHLEYMAKGAEVAVSREQIDRFLGLLSNAGLLSDRGQGIFEFHPALTGYLRSKESSEESEARQEAWARSFVDVMGSLADAVAPKELHEQRLVFHVHERNFRHALEQAERLGVDTHLSALTQSLASFAQNTRDFEGAEELYRRLLEQCKAHKDPEGEAVAGHQLGMIAQARRDFDAAEKWYLKSLAIEEKQGDEHGAASTYHQLGMIAQERRDFDAAEMWYLKSLAISEKQGNEHRAAITYHQLGVIAQERRDFDAAEKWYLKSLSIEEKQGNEHGAAITYHQLGVLAGEQGLIVDAVRWLVRALTSFARLNAPHEMEQTVGNVRVYYGRASKEQQAEIRTMWEDAGLSDLPLADEVPPEEE